MSLKYKEFIWLGSLLLMRRWVWNACSIIFLADNCGCGVICHCGMSRGHCCILGTTLSRLFWQLTTPLKKTKKQGRRLCQNVWLLCAYYMVYLLLFLYCGALIGCPGVSKNKTLSSGKTSVVFFSCLKKFKCLGDVLDYVTPITVCHVEVPSFGRFYNLAQILI